MLDGNHKATCLAAEIHNLALMLKSHGILISDDLTEAWREARVGIIQPEE